MGYQKESLNTFFEEVISIIDSCILEKDFPNIKNFKSVLYLSFATFLSYYGYENIDIIYQSFEDTIFLSMSEKDKKSFLDFPKPAYVKTRYEEREEDMILLEDYLYIVENRNIDMMIWLNFFLHEMNHLINSKNNRVIDKQYIRCGISLYDIKKRRYTNKYLNEAFNTLQTESIEKLAYSFAQENIVAPYFYQILKNIKKTQLSKCDYTPYPVKTFIVRALYNDKQFRKIYEDSCLEGNIHQIRDEFDRKTYKNAFQDLSDLIEQCNDDFSLSEQNETITKAKTLIKRYLVS